VLLALNFYFITCPNSLSAVYDSEIFKQQVDSSFNKKLLSQKSLLLPQKKKKNV
jgi:hypothetical protein